MDALEALRTRRSVRRFTQKQVSKENLEVIIEAGALAATANNVQPWEFIVVRNEEVRKIIADTCDYGRFIADAPVCIAVFCKDTKYYLEDGCAATENILVSARALGLGTCWVAGDKKPYCGKIAELLGVPSQYKLISLIALGYGDEPSLHGKRSLKEVLHFEKF